MKNLILSFRNSLGMAFWLVFLFAEKSRLISIGLQAEFVARLRDAAW